MLPAESFADSISFLGYYDLGGLKLANRQCAAVANQCADAIRLFDFSDFAFFIENNGIFVLQQGFGFVSDLLVCRLELNRGKDMCDFISDAFRNCTVGQFILSSIHRQVLRAISVVAQTVPIERALVVTVECADNVLDAVKLAGAFRRLEVCRGTPSRLSTR